MRLRQKGDESEAVRIEGHWRPSKAMNRCPARPLAAAPPCQPDGASYSLVFTPGPADCPPILPLHPPADGRHPPPRCSLHLCISRCRHRTLCTRCTHSTHCTHCYTSAPRPRRPLRSLETLPAATTDDCHRQRAKRVPVQPFRQSATVAWLAAL